MTAIKQHRERKGWTQGELAERCGVVKSAVSMWETGERKPDIVMLKRLAIIFGCTADELLASIPVEETAEGS